MFLKSAVSTENKRVCQHRQRVRPYIALVLSTMMWLMCCARNVSAATLDFDLQPSADNYTFTIDSDRLFAIDDAINKEVYQNSICFNNETNSPVNLKLVNVREVSNDTWLYRNSHIRIYDGKGVYYDGKLEGATLEVDMPEEQSDEIHFDYHYSDPNARVPDNVAMGRSMECRFTFQVTQKDDLSSGWADTGDMARIIWIIAACAIVCFAIWRFTEKKRKQKKIEEETKNMDTENQTNSGAGEKETPTTPETQTDQAAETAKAASGSSSDAASGAESRKKTKHTVGGVILDVVIIFLLVVTVGTIFIRMRFDPHYVETGSMRPAYEIGALVLVDDEAYDNSDPQVGDVAVYRTGSREVMHRIKKITSDGRYIFQGDNNNTDDFTPIDKSEIVGKAVWHTNLAAPVIRKIKHLENV